ncbi:MAG: hypothetical protein FWE31_01130 [Firmicutes bacterium]|nr:hypothetical protein [Bacillota bacterium]
MEDELEITPPEDGLEEVCILYGEDMYEYTPCHECSYNDDLDACIKYRKLMPCFGLPISPEYMKE